MSKLLLLDYRDHWPYGKIRQFELMLEVKNNTKKVIFYRGGYHKQAAKLKWILCQC